MHEIKKRLGKFGSTFAFEFALEMAHKQVIAALTKGLKHIQAEDIPAMVREGRFPPLDHIDFSVATDNVEHLEKLSVFRMMDLVAEVRPDLAQAIVAEGMAGAQYVVRLRLLLLERVKHPELAMSKSTEYAAPSNMARATCDTCHKSWTVPKSPAQVGECPFCHSH